MRFVSVALDVSVSELTTVGRARAALSVAVAAASAEEWSARLNVDMTVKLYTLAVRV